MVFSQKAFPKIFLLGNPNCGKTTLFNVLTGKNARVGNYSGVTVTQEVGSAKTPQGKQVIVSDLPGIYDFEGNAPDTEITKNILFQKHYADLFTHQAFIFAVLDATQLERSLTLILNLLEVLRPTGKECGEASSPSIFLLVNMLDLAEKQGICVHFSYLSQYLKLPVIPMIATQKKGVLEVLQVLDKELSQIPEHSKKHLEIRANPTLLDLQKRSSSEAIRKRFKTVQEILSRVITQDASTQKNPTHPVKHWKNWTPFEWSKAIDRILLHPFLGSVFLIVLFICLFQAVFYWAELPTEWIRMGISWISKTLQQTLPNGMFKSLVLDGILTGTGIVCMFLPQILILFFFILLLESSGYMPRIGFLMDRLMACFGLQGKAIIPIISSFSCTVTGIMATRTLESRKNRILTILMTPFLTCSAKLPLYTLIISTFIPNQTVLRIFKLQGLVFFALYVLGICSGFGVAFILHRTLLKSTKKPFLMELPTYKWPVLKNIGMSLYYKMKFFLIRTGSMIFGLSILMWFFFSYPKPLPDHTEPAILQSYAGKLGHWLMPLLQPLGFSWEIAVALFPGFLAREVMISALGTVYAIQNQSESLSVFDLLREKLQTHWSLATALSVLIWYAFAPQCFSTLAITYQETKSWKWPVFLFTYMTLLAYLAAFLTYQTTRYWMS